MVFSLFADENQLKNKHVESSFAARLDAGSTPANSTKKRRCKLLQRRFFYCADFVILFRQLEVVKKKAVKENNKLY